VNDGSRNETSESIATVVGAFTRAELALGEVTAAAERFRAASDQLAAAQTDLANARQGLGAATDATNAVAGELRELVGGLAAATRALEAIEPARLWQHLEQAEASRIAVAAESRARHERIEASVSLAVRLGVAGVIGSAAIALLVVLMIVGVAN
jgi:hypothetical protein